MFVMTRDHKLGKWIDQEFRQAVGKRLREARKRRPLEEVGQHVGVTRQTVWQWEAGKAYPGPERLLLIADLYGVSVDWLLGRTGASRVTLNDISDVDDLYLVDGFVQMIRERRQMYEARSEQPHKTEETPEAENG